MQKEEQRSRLCIFSPHVATCLPPILVMEESHKQVEDIDSASNGSDSDSFVDDSAVDEVSTSGQDDKLHLEEPLSDKEIEELIAEFLEVETKLQVWAFDCPTTSPNQPDHHLRLRPTVQTSES